MARRVDNVLRDALSRVGVMYAQSMFVDGKRNNDKEIC